MKLIYIAYGNVSVFDSQVVALLNYYREKDIIDEVILILGTDHKANGNNNVPKKLNKEIKVLFYKHFPQYWLIEKLTIASIKKSLKSISKFEDYVIHVRNDVLAHYVYRSIIDLGLNPTRIIADVRGAGLEQLIEFSNKSRLIILLKKMQRRQVNNSLGKIKNISVVSESLKQYILKNVTNNIVIHINSCLSNLGFVYDEKERLITREKLNLKENESLLVLSTGGDNAWQNTKKTIEMLTENNFKVLNLSRTAIPHKNVINKFVPYEEMFKYLCAADAAIIWRNNSVTNKVASPVKFSEYVCCGLPVLTNDSIDLITDYVKLKNCGKIIDSLESIDETMLNDLKGMNRKTISSMGQKIFGIHSIADQYAELYKSI